MDLSPATIRPLMENDISTVADIAENSMEYPWSETVFRDCMKADYHGWVLCDNSKAQEKILGFLVALDQVGESQLLNVCVSKDSQRRGYGRFLLEHMIAHAQSK